jgi:hypothetical protein
MFAILMRKIADALQKLKHPLSGFLPDIVLHSPAFQSGDTKIIGEVSTVKVELKLLSMELSYSL